MNSTNPLSAHRSVAVTMAPTFLLLLALLLPTAWVSAAVDVSTLDIHNVPCTATTTACECRQDADVCVFNISIALFHSFARYYVDSQYGELINTARIYYFDDEGKLVGHPGPGHPFCPNAAEEDLSECTPTYTFDGSTFKSFVGVNGQVPGPSLIVSTDQTVVANVDNDLQMETTSIHWHGMYQYNTYFMDGVHHITQHAIDPQKSFRYIFKASPSGTHWYHSHTGVQRSDGLFGALIVRERPAVVNQIRQALPTELRQYQDKPAEHTISIADWYREPAIDAYSLLESAIWFYSNSGLSPPGPEDNPEPFTIGPDGKEAGNYPFWSALINGKGKHPSNDIPYLKSRLHIFSVDPGQVYRFRLIGAINNYVFRFSIDEHQLWVVGTDGYWVDPVPVDYIALQSGERYDFLLITKASPSKNDFWMRSEAQEIDVEENTTPTEPAPYRLLLDRAAESILHYNVAGSTLPTSADYVRIKENSIPVNSTCTTSKPCKVMNCPWNIHSSYKLSCIYVDSLRLIIPTDESLLPKVTPDEEIFFQFGTEGVGALSSVNGRRTLFPSVPPALTGSEEAYQQLVNEELCKELDNPNICNGVRLTVYNPNCSCVHVRGLDYQKSYQMVYTVAGPHGTFSHPVHMHGHSFWVLKIGLPPIDSTTGFVNCFSDDLVCNRPPNKPRCGYVTNPITGAPDDPNDYVCTTASWAPGREYQYPPTASGKIDPRTPRKDTIMAPAGGYAVIAMVADNPGVWFMHCHVENHAVEGMGVVLNEARPNQNPAPDDMRLAGPYKPTLQEFYNWLDHNPNPAPTTCAAAGFSGCCNQPGSACYVSAGNCWCDSSCRQYGNCCPDIDTVCPQGKSGTYR